MLDKTKTQQNEDSSASPERKGRLMLTSRQARYEDLSHLASNLREADREEIKAASGLDPLDCLKRGFSMTVGPMVGVNEDDLPVCIGGVVPLAPSVGAVWAVATTELDRHKMSFLRQSRPWVDLWQAQYPILTNCVDERNRVHIEWLRWLGFTFINRHPEWGAEKRPFLQFVRINPNV